MTLLADSAWRTDLDRALAQLSHDLGENLFSCIAYGSAVRGEMINHESDINLLIVLRESTPQAHEVIGEARRRWPRISPFVLGQSGLARSQQVFALKFHSIQRNYKVIHGIDVLADFNPGLPLLRFLVEQSLRNLRLRLNYAFITTSTQRKRYSRFLMRSLPALRTALSELAQIEGHEVPLESPKRMTMFGELLQVDTSILHNLLELRQSRRTLSTEEVTDYHTRLCQLMNQVISWVETRWPLTSPTTQA